LTAAGGGTGGLAGAGTGIGIAGITDGASIETSMVDTSIVGTTTSAIAGVIRPIDPPIAAIATHHCHRFIPCCIPRYLTFEP
jgi:hypothetical protein